MASKHKVDFQTHKWILDTLKRENIDLFYYRDCLLPCLALTLEMYERGRESFDLVELTMLRLIKNKVNIASQAASLCGLAERYVYKIWIELANKGLVQVEADKVELTDLGLQSVISEIPMQKISRTLRLCAFSQQLLPREAYSKSCKRFNLSDASNFNFSNILPEKEMVSLAALDLERMTSRYEVNIPDEVEKIVAISKYEPVFQPARLAIVGKGTPENAFIQFEKKLVKYRLQDIEPLVKPLKEHTLPALKAEEQNRYKNRWEKWLEKEGVGTIESATLSRYGVLSVNIKEAELSWLGKGLAAGLQAILVCGTQKKKPTPVNRFPLQSKDMLDGNTILFTLDNFRQAREAERLVSYIEKAENYYKLTAEKKREMKIGDYLESTFTETALVDFVSLAKKYNINRAIKYWLTDYLEERVSDEG